MTFSARNNKHSIVLYVALMDYTAFTQQPLDLGGGGSMVLLCRPRHVHRAGTALQHGTACENVGIYVKNTSTFLTQRGEERKDPCHACNHFNKPDIRI